MQIDGSGSVTSLIRGAKESDKTQENQTPVGNSAQQSTRSGQSDMVTFTDAAAHMQQLESAIASSPVVNTHRVEQLQHVMNDGNMNIDPTHLAAKIFSFESALNNARSRA